MVLVPAVGRSLCCLRLSAQCGKTRRFRSSFFLSFFPSFFLSFFLFFFPSLSLEVLFRLCRSRFLKVRFLFIPTLVVRMRLSFNCSQPYICVNTIVLLYSSSLFFSWLCCLIVCSHTEVFFGISQLRLVSLLRTSAILKHLKIRSTPTLTLLPSPMLPSSSVTTSLIEL